MTIYLLSSSPAGRARLRSPRINHLLQLSSGLFCVGCDKQKINPQLMCFTELLAIYLLFFLSFATNTGDNCVWSRSREKFFETEEIIANNLVELIYWQFIFYFAANQKIIVSGRNRERNPCDRLPALFLGLRLVINYRQQDCQKFPLYRYHSLQLSPVSPPTQGNWNKLVAIERKNI